VPAPTLDYSNANSLWCSVLAETLFRCGVREAVLSPGSRSTPLTFAFVRQGGIQATPVLDERSAGFFALGLAKRSGRPVVLVCTSGTAAANYLPAIVEAHESGVPLLVLTADRPPEMRACSSGQTIDQLKLFGAYVSFFHEFAVPEAKAERLRYLRQTLIQAVERSLWPVGGPVHLNCPFRDPLVPEKQGNCETLAPQLEDESFWSHLVAPAPQAEDQSPLPELSGERGLVIAGPIPEGSDPVAHAAAVCSIARALGWPLLADTLSQLRQQVCNCPALITHYDAVLRSEQAAGHLCPEQVLVVGALPTSKVLRGWLERQDGLRVYLLSLFPESRDALHLATRVIRRSPASFASSLGGAVPPVSGYATDWARASEAARSHIAGLLGPERALVEPKVAWLLGQMLQRGASLMVANSMPVRDLEYLWGGQQRGLRVFFNRGANGIDGTVSTAFGIAQDGPPAVLLIGDLSLLHDSNGLLLHRRLRGSLTILLIDNNGGGIFEHLAVSRFDPPFEEFFATPQQVDFAALAAVHGLHHQVVCTWEELAEQLRQLPPSGVRVVELRTDRKADAALRKRLFEGASRAAAAALGL